eukprot:TRINITY_DN7568_c0_g1_i1.p1 TRINITY_DN7568_c0_g1~~TRINITY_DN7568_c0_g1_i1.p1  ORF type:complete len:576 (-),score=101.87 TRINITY_DN7568_c0_g1_i1:4-1731(-)
MLRQFIRYFSSPPRPLNATIPHNSPVLPNSSPLPSLLPSELQFNKQQSQLKDLLENKKWDESLAQFELMQRTGNVSQHTYRLMIRDIGKVNINKAWELYQEMVRVYKQPQSFCLRYFLCHWAKKRNTQKVEELLLEMKRHTRTLNLASCQRLMEMYSEMRNVTGAIELLEEMKSSRVAPDVRIYAELLKLWIKVDDFQKVEWTFAQMKKNSNDAARPNEVIYGILINGWARKNPKRAKELLDEMETQGIKPNRFIFNSLVYMWAKLGDFEKAREVIQQMESSNPNVLCDTFTFNSLMSSVNTRKQLHWVLGMMKLRRIPFDIVTYNTLLRFWVKQNDEEGIEKVLKKIKEAKIAFNIRTYNTLLSYYSEKGQIDRVDELLKEMKNNKIDYDLVTYNTLMDAWSKHQMSRRTESLLTEMILKRIQIDIYTCGTFLQMKEKSPEAVEMVLDYMKANSIKKSRVVCISLFWFWGETGDIPRIASLLEEMRATGVPRCIETYMELFRALETTNNHHHLVWVLKEMQRDGVVPSSETYELVITMAEAAGDRSSIEFVTKELQRLEANGSVTSPSPTKAVP